MGLISQSVVQPSNTGGAFFYHRRKTKSFGYKSMGVVNTFAHVISAVGVMSHFNGLIA